MERGNGVAAVPGHQGFITNPEIILITALSALSLRSAVGIHRVKNHKGLFGFVGWHKAAAGAFFVRGTPGTRTKEITRSSFFLSVSLSRRIRRRSAGFSPIASLGEYVIGVTGLILTETVVSRWVLIGGVWKTGGPVGWFRRWSKRIGNRTHILELVVVPASFARSEFSFADISDSNTNIDRDYLANYTESRIIVD